jgi:tripartite-type tricarboxylate transporter receptor subunit TctC
MKLPHRRQFLELAAGAAALPALLAIARAQSWPSRPVRWVVPFATGGGADVAARLIGPWLSERLGQPVIIENKAGAGTNLGVQSVINSPPDGYTLLFASDSNASNATLYETLPFNFLRDIAPVASIIHVPIVMVVNPSVPAKTVGEFIAYAKANPGKINMASSGVGTGVHLAGELFKAMTGVNMIHVPYRGAGPALTDMIAGQVQVMFPSLPGSLPYLQSGALRALAVTTAFRSDAIPNVPTLKDSVPGYEASGWYGVGLNKDTPGSIVERLNREINAILADPKVKSRLAELGGTALVGSPAEFGKFMAAETEKWGKVIRTAGIKAE